MKQRLLRDHHWPIMTVGPLRTSCQLRSVSCVVFHKSALSGSAVRGLLSVLEIGFHMIIISQPQGKKVQHTRKQKMASLHSNLQWLFSSYGSCLGRVRVNMMRNIFCCEMLRSKDLQHNSSITYINKTIKRHQYKVDQPNSFLKIFHVM